MRRLPCSVALAAALLPAGAFFHADMAVASDTSLIDMNQDLALIHSPRSVPNPERTVSPFQPFDYFIYLFLIILVYLFQYLLIFCFVSP